MSTFLLAKFNQTIWFGELEVWVKLSLDYCGILYWASKWQISIIHLPSYNFPFIPFIGCCGLVMGISSIIFFFFKFMSYKNWRIWNWRIKQINIFWCIISYIIHVCFFLQDKFKMMEKKIRLKSVNPHIICSLCKGYLIDATTITECLHTCNILFSSLIPLLQSGFFHALYLNLHLDISAYTHKSSFLILKVDHPF